jgi:hypothetical protein
VNDVGDLVDVIKGFCVYKLPNLQIVKSRQEWVLRAVLPKLSCRFWELPVILCERAVEAVMFCCDE